MGKELKLVKVNQTEQNGKKSAQKMLTMLKGAQECLKSGFCRIKNPVFIEYAHKEIIKINVLYR